MMSIAGDYTVVRNIKVTIIVITLVLVAVFADLKCPAPPHWNIRARLKCNSTNDYICLFDKKLEIFAEFCSQRPNLEPRGYSAILLDGITRQECSSQKYQPFTFWTNGSSECVYQKSLCTEEGQVVYQNGATKTDRTCHCDYTRNYAFTTRPRNKCFCVQSEEDCSCIMKDCPIGQLLTPDYECVSVTNWKQSFKCNEINQQSINENRSRLDDKGKESMIETDFLSDLTDYSSYASLAVMGMCLLFIGTLILRQRLGYLKEDKKKTLMSQEEKNLLLMSKEIIKNEKEKWSARMKKFVTTRAASFVLDGIQQRQCVFISGPPGCGKSATAYYAAFKIEETEGYMIVPVSASDLLRHTIPNTKQLFIIDDVMGRYTSEESWENVSLSIKETLEKHKMIKVIMTSRSNIYYWISSDSQNEFYLHCNFLSDLKLTMQERKGIFNSYLDRDLYSAVNDSVLMLYDFLPSLCVMCSEGQEHQYTDFFLYPLPFISEEMQQFRLKSNVSNIALALTVVFDNHVDISLFETNDSKLSEILKDIVHESGCTQCPSISLVYSVLKSLNGSFVKETDVDFGFLNNYLFEVISSYIGVLFFNTILKHGSVSFVTERLRLFGFKDTTEYLKISVIPDSESRYFQRLINDIKRGHITLVFSNNQMKNVVFRQKLLGHFRKKLKSKDLIDSYDGSTVLHAVSSLGYIDLVEYFLKHDSPLVNQKDNKGRTALQIACSKRHHLIAEILLHNNADIKTKDNEGRTALHITCNNGDEYLVGLLLKKQADVNIVDKLGNTPLHLACKEGHCGIVKALVDTKKIKLNIKNKKGYTPSDVSSQVEREKILQILSEHKNTSIVTTDDDWVNIKSIFMA